MKRHHGQNVQKMGRVGPVRKHLQIGVGLGCKTLSEQKSEPVAAVVVNLWQFQQRDVQFVQEHYCGLVSTQRDALVC